MVLGGKHGGGHGIINSTFGKGITMGAVIIIRASSGRCLQQTESRTFGFFPFLFILCHCEDTSLIRGLRLWDFRVFFCCSPFCVGGDRIGLE